MRFVDRYPIFVTARLAECRDFYTRYLGFQVGFEASWFVWLTADEGSASIAFMSPDHPSAPPGPERFGGTGMCFELQVEDAAAAHAELAGKGLAIDYPLTDELFGQRRFGFRDPAGLWVDVVEQTAPEEGFWERYPAPAGAGTQF